MAAFTAEARSGVTVPTLGFGIRFLGPKTFPSRPTIGIISGEAIHLSNSILPFNIVSIRSSAPTMSAPALVASVALSPFAKTATLMFFPDPCGNAQTPLTT